jgi:GAF domain-containing protein/HAMP domain-containing protein
MNRISFETILKRYGERYIIIAAAIGQVFGLMGAIPGIVSTVWSTNHNLSTGELISKYGLWFWLASQLIILFICWRITPNARNQISHYTYGITQPEKEKEFSAWKEITNLSTQYGIASFFINLLFLAVIPSAIVHLRFDQTNFPSSVYVFLGGLAFVIGSTLLSTFLLDWFTTPARAALLPKDFEDQLQGRSGALLNRRFLVTSIAIIIMILVTIVPIGHAQMEMLKSEGVNAMQALNDMQIQILSLSGLLLIVGTVLLIFLIQSVAGPARNLTDVLQKIGRGDFSQRAPVLATDELATLAIYFNRMLARFEELQSSLENQVAERTRQLAATNEVGRVASAILDPDELLSKIANLITEQFNYYYAAIYLLDSSEKWVELKEATGQAGDILKQNRHRLEAAGKSMVAACIREKTPRIVQNTAEETQRIDNPLLPYTRSEIALPLIVGSRAIGAMDVQSTKPSDFNEEIIETMQNMAAQVAIALENARLFQESQQNIKEMQAIQKQYLLEGWNTIKTFDENLEYSVGESSDTEQLKIENPIVLRDQVFGKITLEAHEEWTPEQRSLVDAVAAQAAIALENARLVSESRQIAQRERTMSEINSKIWSSSTIDSILQNVVKELGRRLGASTATIELKLDDES